jgi:hypothetical protein
LASAPELAEVPGLYFTRGPLASAPVKARARLPSRAARDPEAARRLWDESEGLIASVSG